MFNIGDETLKEHLIPCQTALSGRKIMVIVTSICLAILARSAFGAEKSQESTEKLQATGKVLFEDKFDNLDNWHPEGIVKGVTLAEPGVMRLDCTGSQQGGQGCMAFCKKDFPDNICVEFDFFMEKNNGLAITFIAMKGVKGEDAIEGLPQRKGVFADYVQNKRLQSYHVSICRYNDVGNHTGRSNWRRNPGLNMMLSGKDLCKEPRKKYRVAIFKKGPQLQIQVDGKIASGFTDPGTLPGAIPTDGKVGFRLIGSEAVARFSNFKVTALK